MSSDVSTTTECEKDAPKDFGRPKARWGTRHTVTVMIFLGMSTVNALRVNLSVAIVAMVNATSDEGNSEIGTECPGIDDVLGASGGSGEFEWNLEEQGIILGAFFYGYVVTQVPGGVLAEKFGAKWIFGLGLLATSVLTLLTPVAARSGKGLLIAVRVLEGLALGGACPCTQALVSKWTPLPERSQLASFIWAGTHAGTVLSLAISGVLADKVNWESIFYVSGGLGCLWFICWAFLVSDSPDTHPRISQEEKVYIRLNIKSSESGKQLPFPPLLKILTSVPFLALMIVHTANNWGYYTLLTQTPTYLNNIQHFPLTANGFVSALPYLAGWLFAMILGLISDHLVKNGKLSEETARKLFNSIGHYGAALGCIWLAFVECNQVLSIVALSISVGLNGGVYSGFVVNHVDLSPNYAGTLFGITNMMANISGFLTPYMTGAITTGNPTTAAWRVVFLISAGVFAFGNTVFVIFGSGKVQSWNTYWKVP